MAIRISTKVNSFPEDCPIEHFPERSSNAVRHYWRCGSLPIKQCSNISPRNIFCAGISKSGKEIRLDDSLILSPAFLFRPCMPLQVFAGQVIESLGVSLNLLFCSRINAVGNIMERIRCSLSRFCKFDDWE